MATANPSLKADHLRYIERVKASDDKVISYKCPCCDEHIETRAAPHGATWDTLSTCYECNALHMKITQGDRADGRVLDLA